MDYVPLDWAQFDWPQLLLHIVAISMGTLQTLLAEWSINPHHKERRRTLAFLVSFGTLFGSIAYALMFDGKVLYPFDWRSIGFIVYGTLTCSICIRLGLLAWLMGATTHRSNKLAGANRVFTPGSQAEVFTYIKEPAGKIHLAYDFTNWLESGDTIATVGSITFNPSGTGVPTATTAALDATSKIVKTTLDAGTTVWGSGRMTFVVTTTGGEKREVNTLIQIVQP